MLRSERSVKLTAMFKTQCGSCVLPAPAAEVRAALCPATATGLQPATSTLKRFGYFFVGDVCVAV